MAVDYGYAWIGAQAPVELAVGDVERDHVRGAALEQAVGEAASRGANVERATALDLHVQRIERVGELDPAARDERRAADELELRVVVDQLSGLLDAAPPGQQQHLAGDHRRRRARPRREQSALGQEAVDPDP